MSDSDDPHANDLGALEDVLSQLAHDYSVEQLARLRHIVANNIRRGRWARVQSRTPQESLLRYVERVASFLQAAASWPARLATKPESAWSELHTLLRQRAYNRLVKFGTAPSVAQMRAEDHAQRTCLQILEAQPYPYDVPYIAWVSKILNNAIQKETLRSRDLLDHDERLEPERSDELDEDEGVVDPRTQGQSELLDNQVDMQWALAQLPATQRLVIERTLTQEISDQAIAAELNISSQAVYNLRHRGRKRLEALLKRT